MKLYGLLLETEVAVSLHDRLLLLRFTTKSVSFLPLMKVYVLIVITILKELIVKNVNRPFIETKAVELMTLMCVFVSRLKILNYQQVNQKHEIFPFI